MDDSRGWDGIEDGALDTIPVVGVDVEPPADDPASDEASPTNDPRATGGSDTNAVDEALAAPSVAAAEGPLAADAGAPPVPQPVEPLVVDEPPEPCGLFTCGAGYACCNPSCGSCVRDGESCDPTPCTPRIQYPVSTMCGQNTCSVGEVCCNPTCGTCVADGQTCDTTPCAPRIRYPL